MGVDCSDFTMELYVVCVLEKVYDNEYILNGKMNLSNDYVSLIKTEDNTEIIVELEKITNKRIAL